MLGLPLPSPAQWASFTPVEREAILKLAASVMGSPEAFMQYMIASWPAWGRLPPIVPGSVPGGGKVGPYAM